LFRAVLLASASIPGVFPPVMIEAQSHGKDLQELHNDGTITGALLHRAGIGAGRNRHRSSADQSTLRDRPTPS